MLLIPRKTSELCEAKRRCESIQILRPGANARPPALPHQGVWGMGKENTRCSRSVFTRSPSPSDLLVPFASLQKELAPLGEIPLSL